jgi:hypothetical protein
MGQQKINMMSYYVHKKAKLLKNFDKTASLIRDYVVSQYGEKLAEILNQTAREEYEELISHMPHIDSLPALNSFLRISALELSVFRAMKEHGKSAPEAWDICHEALRARTAAMPKLLRRLLGWYLFTGFVKNRARKMAGRDLGGFTIEYIEEEGDWGVNYRRCAIYDFLKGQDAADFAPYVCLSDIALSDAMGWGLKRTETLADGSDKCDFRFRRGAQTEISSRISEVQAAIDRITGNEIFERKPT